MLPLVVGQVRRPEHNQLLELLGALAYQVFAELHGRYFQIVEGGQDFNE